MSTTNKHSKCWALAAEPANSCLVQSRTWVEYDLHSLLLKYHQSESGQLWLLEEIETRQGG